MLKKVLTAGSFLLGGAGLVLVGYLQANPLLFTQPVAEVGVQEAAASAVPPIAEGRNQVIVVSDVVITRRRRAAAPLGPVANLEPCATWNEVGALYVGVGGATGVRSVRNLCP